MRINLTKKEIINSIYMQLGFSKKFVKIYLKIFYQLILDELIKNKKVKISKFGTFILRHKKSRIGRNPKTLEKKLYLKEMLYYLNHQKNLKKYINNK